MRREDWGWDDPPRGDRQDFDMEAGPEAFNDGTECGQCWRVMGISMLASILFLVLAAVVIVWAIDVGGGSGEGRKWHHHGHGFKHGLGDGFGAWMWLLW
jgi:hypothetical protein